MNILRRHFLKEFFKYFAVSVMIVITVSTVVEFFDRVDQFYMEEAPAYLIFKYLLMRAPGIILYAFPLSSLFSVLIVMGIASKNRETVAIKASGGSLKRFFSCFIVLGFFISLFAFVFGETVVPVATKEAGYIKNIRIQKKSYKIITRQKALWLKGTDGSLIRIDDFVEDENMILKTGIFSFDPSFGLKKRIEADEAEWLDGVWLLKNVTVYDFKEKTVRKHASLISTSLEEPKIFREVMKKPVEMSFMELHDYYSRLKKAGFKNPKYVVRLYEKIAYPLTNFVIIIFAAAIGLSSGWGGGVKAAGIGVLISIVYWLLYSVNMSLGMTDVLKPWLAPLITPFLFGIAGAVMYWRVKE